MSVTYTVHDKTKNLNNELTNDTSLRPVYLNATKKGNTTVLSLSRDGGQYVYCVSNHEHDNPLEYFRIKGKGAEREKEAIEVPQKGPKRAKQGSLFNFMKPG